MYLPLWVVMKINKKEHNESSIGACALLGKCAVIGGSYFD